MPIYAYRCEACGFAKDVLQKMSDPQLTVCLSCGAPSFKKQVTAAGFQLKGTGWYATDFRNGAGTTAPAVGAAGESGKDGKDGKSGEKTQQGDKAENGGKGGKGDGGAATAPAPASAGDKPAPATTATAAAKSGSGAGSGNAAPSSTGNTPSTS
jgi:putative FmdB family regulatory protein